MADITMPKMGFDMTEGTIVRWLKKVGDFVNKGEAVAEIETDKVTIEIESFVSGTLSEIVSPAGSRTPVGGVIARTSDGAGATHAAPVVAAAPVASVAAPVAPVAAPVAPVAAPVAAVAAGDVKASPIAKRRPVNTVSTSVPSTVVAPKVVSCVTTSLPPWQAVLQVWPPLWRPPPL